MTTTTLTCCEWVNLKWIWGVLFNPARVEGTTATVDDSNLPSPKMHWKTAGAPIAARFQPPTAAQEHTCHMSKSCTIHADLANHHLVELYNNLLNWFPLHNLRTVRSGLARWAYTIFHIMSDYHQYILRLQYPSNIQTIPNHHMVQ